MEGGGQWGREEGRKSRRIGREGEGHLAKKECIEGISKGKRQLQKNIIRDLHPFRMNRN